MMKIEDTAAELATVLAGVTPDGHLVGTVTDAGEPAKAYRARVEAALVQFGQACASVERDRADRAEARLEPVIEAARRYAAEGVSLGPGPVLKAALTAAEGE